MALTYDDSATLMNDQKFRGRVKTACLKFAASIQNEATNTPAHNSRYRWSQQCYTMPDTVAQQVTPPTVMDPNVQSAGANIDDTTLQGAVETAIQAFI